MKIPFPGPIPWLLYSSPPFSLSHFQNQKTVTWVRRGEGFVLKEMRFGWMEGVKHNGKEEREGS